ncbi:MAG TPA: tRNA (adenosine(37)-N6)-threonylcarbamoyltransferase complex dimerization subunit type 1 TsaB [Sphingomicrobium sp.]|nr:tRNA (adenosine(37)-N6)-threonylcarbamoyltransferase complex dimerization subunit type 1 TsaB [Sphingomicrobium sp.]
MLLAFDTSSSACTAALFDGSGECVARKDELIGRGHSERLVPMLDELLEGRRADRILVGVGPGSFTGIRVAIAAAHGLAIGWDAELSGMSSLALLAASAVADGEIGVSIIGGHGELFVQQFDATTAEPTSELRNLVPAKAAEFITAPVVLGSGAEQLVDARGWGEAREAWPLAANALKVPSTMRSLPPKPVYARAPDAKVREAA